MAEGVTHISLPTQEYDRGRQEKIERQTNKQSLGLTKSRGRYCNTTCMCGLSLAGVTSENSTMLLESDILSLFFTGPYLVSSPLCSVSGVDCPSMDPRQPLCSPLSCPVSTALSLLSSHQLSSLLSNYQLPLLLSNYQLCSPLGRVVNSHSPPRTTSGYGEISCPRILCLVSRQNRQLNRLLWQPTHIVLHCRIFLDYTLIVCRLLRRG